MIRVMEIIPTLGGGGAEKMVLDLTEGLQRKGCQVTVVSLYGPEYATGNRLEYAKRSGIKVEFLNKTHGFDLRLLFRLWRLISEDRPDIIHTHLSSFRYIAVLGHLCDFSHIHTMHSIIGNEQRVYRMLLRDACRRNRTSFVVLSENIATAMKAMLKTECSSLYCIPNGIDRDFFAFKEREFDARSTAFITVGSLIPVKNHKMVIEAFARMQRKTNRNDKLKILGEGVLHKELQGIIEDYGLENQIILAGNVSDVRKYLYDADVFVMTSHYEGVSLALLEAASTGLPIVTTNTGNTPVVVGSDAILVDDDDVQGLSEQMLEIAINSNYRELYVERAKQLSMRFDKNTMVDSYFKLCENILSKRIRAW